MGRWWMGLPAAAGLVWTACSQAPSSTVVAHLTAVCAPTQTQAGAGFQLGVTGGCGGTAADYRCVVNKLDTVVEVTLLGPEPCSDCQCAVVEQICSVPALDTGSWSLTFIENAGFNRTVDVAPQHPVFQCTPQDGGM